MKYIYIIALCFFQLFQVVAQDTVAHVYTYGGIKNEGCSQIRATNDGGYIMIGYTTSFGVGDNNMYAIKIDSLCKPQWSITIGGNRTQVGYGLTPTSDKGYAFVGFTDSYGNGGYDAYLVKVDSNGNVQWQKTYGGSDWDFAYSVKQTSDGGYVLCGQTYSYGSGNGDVYVVRTDKNGDTLWTRAIGGQGYDVGNSLQIQNDSLYIIVGSTTSYGMADTNVYFIELNSSGNLLASKTYGTHYNSVAYSITPTIDKGYMITGSMDSIIKGVQNELCLKTDSAGNCKWWSQITNGPWPDIGKDIVQASDTTYLSVGSSDGGGYGSSSMHVMQHEPDGTYMAGPSMGGNKAQFGSSVAIGKNGNVVCAGTTSSYGQGDFDVYLIRFTNDSILQNYTLVITSYADTPVVASVINPQPFTPGIKVFPNPATTSATILLQGQSEENYYLSLCNEIGQEVISKASFTHTVHDQSIVHIETSGLSAGIYFYTIYSASERVGGGKLIVE
jgi:hypothetical protein